VAFSLSRALGPAVTRNRLRRRLRELLRRHSALPGGLLLIGARPRAVELTFDQLSQELDALLAALPTAAAPSNA
jgi:ribonuclease P protein component